MLEVLGLSTHKGDKGEKETLGRLLALPPQFPQRTAGLCLLVLGLQACAAKLAEAETCWPL